MPLGVGIIVSRCCCTPIGSIQCAAGSHVVVRMASVTFGSRISRKKLVSAVRFRLCSSLSRSFAHARSKLRAAFSDGCDAPLFCCVASINVRTDRALAGCAFSFYFEGALPAVIKFTMARLLACIKYAGTGACMRKRTACFVY